MTKFELSVIFMIYSDRIIPDISASDFPEGIYAEVIGTGITDKAVCSVIPENKTVLIVTDDISAAEKFTADNKPGRYVLFIGDLSDAAHIADKLYDIRPSDTDSCLLGKIIISLAKKLKDSFYASFYESTLLTTINTVPDMMWYKRLDGIHMLVNDAFSDIVCKPKSDIHGKDHFYIWDAPRPAEGNAFACAESEEIAVSTGKTYVCDEPVRTRDGMKQFTTYKTPVYDMFGNVFGTVGLGHDVTNFSNLGIELSILVENMPFPMTIFSADLEVVRMNSSFREVAGVTEEKDFDYRKWKNSVPIPVGEPREDKKHRSVSREYMIDVGGEKHSFMLSELEIRDFFDNVSGYFCTMRDITYQRAYEESIIKTANTDMLTGMFNRRYFYSSLADISKKPFHLLYLDLDRFKAVNDLYGHSAGDDVLIRTAGLIREYFPGMLAARLGGDEFAVADDKNPHDCIERKCAELEEAVAEAFAKYGVTVSIGITFSDGAKGDIDSVIRDSDEKMYDVKKRHHKETTVGLREMEYCVLFEKLMRDMTELNTFDLARIREIISGMCRFMRISRASAAYYEDLRHEENSDGEFFTYYDSGEDVPMKMVSSMRVVSDAMSVSSCRVYQAEGAEPWSASERERAEMMMRIIMIYVNEFRLKKTVEKLAFYDADGYRNLRWYFRYVGRLSDSGKLGGKAAVHINLINFTKVIEEYGKEVGDVVLHGFFEKISVIAGSSGAVCRLGGDNFIVICSSSALDELTECLSGTDVVYDEKKGAFVHVSATAGIYVLPDNFKLRNQGDIMTRILSAAMDAHSHDGRGIVYYSDRHS